MPYKTVSRNTVKLICLLQTVIIHDKPCSFWSDTAPDLGLHCLHRFSLKKLSIHLDTLGRLTPLVYKKNNYCDFLFGFMHIKPFSKKGLL